MGAGMRTNFREWTQFAGNINLTVSEDLQLPNKTLIINYKDGRIQMDHFAKIKATRVAGGFKISVWFSLSQFQQQQDLLVSTLAEFNQVQSKFVILANSE